MMPKWAAEITHTCLNIRPGEKCLILADEPLRAEMEILAGAAGQASSVPVRTQLLLDAARPIPALPDDFLQQAATAEVILVMLAAFDPEREYPAFLPLMPLIGNGRTRLVMMSYITHDILEHELSADYTQIAAETLAVAEALRGTAELRVTTDLGTNLRLRVAGRSWLTDTGLLHGPGFGNLPAGEVFIAPLEDSANGVLIIDGTLHQSRVDQPIRVVFEAGQAIYIEGGADARLLENLLALNAGRPGAEWARFIGEFGIGTHPMPRLRGNIATDEKARGTIHVALGRNDLFGGQNTAVMHLDGVVTQPSVWADDRLILSAGRLLIGASDSNQ